LTGFEPAVREASGLKASDSYTNEFVKVALAKYRG